MSDEPPVPKPKPRRRRRLLRVLSWLISFAMLTLITLGVLVCLVLQNLDFITEWSIARLIPGASVQLKRVELHGWNEVRVQELELSAKASGAVLLRLEGGRMLFAYDELLSGKLQEIELIAPELTASPDLFALFSGKGSENPDERRVPPGWSVNHLRIDKARFSLPASETLPVDVQAMFSVDWKDLDLLSDRAREVRELTIDEISVSWAGSETVVAHIEKILVGITLEGIFEGRRIDSVSVSTGSLTMDAAGWQQIQSIRLPEPGAARPGPARDPWTVAVLELGKLDVNLTDLAQPLESAHFQVSGTLHELGRRDAGALASEVRISALRIESGQDQDPPMFAMDEARVQFTFDGLAAKRIDEVTLTNPSIHLENEFSRIPDKAGPPRGGQLVDHTPSRAEWQIDRLTTAYGELAYNPQKPGEPIVSARFAFDLQNVGTTTDTIAQLHELVVWDVQLRELPDEDRPILGVDSVKVEFSLDELLEEKTIHHVDVAGGRLWIGAALAKLLAARAPESPGTQIKSNDTGWQIATLDVKGIRTRLDDARVDVSDIFLTINTQLQNIPLGVAAVELLDEVRTLEFADVEIRSPLNREILILKLRSVFVRFTINELLKNHIREIVILRPTIYLNQDLFIYMERASAKDQNAAPAPDRPNWSIGAVETKFGRLVIGSGAGSDVGLPLAFESRVQNLSFDRLAELQIDAALQIPKQSYVFKSYQIELDSVEGDLRFSYPPEKGEQNLVQKLDIAGIRWRQFEAGTSWVAVTFDRQGINGQFGGEAYSGYINGGFSFFFQNDSPWIGWISGERVDTAALTNVISPQNFQMTGPLDFEVQIDAFSKNIDRVNGRFSITEPGDMKITKLDDLLGRIPDTWTAIKESTTRIALETLRDYSYTEAGGRLWFVHSQGVLNLDLAGPSGKRAFEFVLHDGDTSEGLWQDESWGKR